MPRRILYPLAVIVVTVFSCGLRLYAAPRLDVDYDEPVYLADAVAYAKSMRLGDFKMLAWSEETYEHPALYKILYGVVLLTQSPLDRLPDKDLPRLAPIATTAAGPWDIAARYISVFWGTLAVLALALLNPLAGFFLGVSTLSVKYTSEVYLEALPLFGSLMCALAYMRWFSLNSEPSSQREGAKNTRTGILWLALSAISLGIAAASKYVYAIIGVAIVLHLALAVIQKQLPGRILVRLAGWCLLSLLMFFVFDPYLWPHPIARLSQSILFHETFQDSPLVQQYHYPFWQPLRWLSAFSAFYKLRPDSAFLINMDTPIFVLAIVGLPRLFRNRRLSFYWLAVGLAFLLIWTTKWPQYALIILAPFSMAAAEGCKTLWNLGRRLFPSPSRSTSDRR
jgi:hypothetical protein